MTYKGVVKGTVIVLEDDAALPDGATVEVRVLGPRVIETANLDRQSVFADLMKRREAYAGRRIGIDEIIEEEKQDREERFDHWLFPDQQSPS
jgi:hypothetical protein